MSRMIGPARVEIFYFSEEAEGAGELAARLLCQEAAEKTEAIDLLEMGLSPADPDPEAGAQEIDADELDLEELEPESTQIEELATAAAGDLDSSIGADIWSTSNEVTPHPPSSPAHTAADDDSVNVASICLLGSAEA
ncbi:MAG: hypothetical protein LBM75_06985, partial [Myxococcales bacterium]|nr:hypothetical protein [Myxococcales bacterium]